jgi:hypothetical protein
MTSMTAVAMLMEDCGKRVAVFLQSNLQLEELQNATENTGLMFQFLDKFTRLHISAIYNHSFA